MSYEWHEEEARLQFEVADCVETKTVTTTTTTKRSYPPLRVRPPRALYDLNTKEYPLARQTMPPELAKSGFTLDMPGHEDDIAWSFGSEFQAS